MPPCCIVTILRSRSYVALQLPFAPCNVCKLLDAQRLQLMTLQGNFGEAYDAIRIKLEEGYNFSTAVQP